MLYLPNNDASTSMSIVLHEPKGHRIIQDLAAL